jgi:hypothetical protein
MHDHYHLHLEKQPDNGGTMPSKKIILYTLVDPISPPPKTVFELA